MDADRPMRRDARARRDALIDAAAACFRESGYRVSLEEIAERAGVGRGTLYRNFRDRQALALAIFAREVDRLVAFVDPDAPLEQTLATMIRNGAAASALFARIASELALETQDLVDFQSLGQRLATFLEPVARRAHARGELRTDIDAAQLVIAVRMIGGLLHPLHDDAAIDAQIAGALDLMNRGFRPR